MKLLIFKLRHNLLRSLLYCSVLKCFWNRGPTVYSSSANTKLQYFQKLLKKKKSGTRNIKGPITLFKDTRHLLLCSHKHEVSQKQMESSILAEVASCAERYQCEETCSILSTLTHISKHMLDRLLPEGKLQSVRLNMKSNKWSTAIFWVCSFLKSML